MKGILIFSFNAFTTLSPSSRINQKAARIFEPKKVAPPKEQK